jgi:competence protein ComEA
VKKVTKKEIILIIIFIVLVVFFNIKNFTYKENQKIVIEEEIGVIEDKDEKNSQQDTAQETHLEKKEPKKIKIDICGAVKKPGVIILAEGDRVIDAINRAGGLTDKADVLRINRSKYVNDGEKIIIPEIGEKIDIGVSSDSDIIGIDKKININTATKEQLTKLDGIGESISERIIKYRQKNNGFKSIEDIKNVSGIGSNKFEQIKDSIKVK